MRTALHLPPLYRPKELQNNDLKPNHRPNFIALINMARFSEKVTDGVSPQQFEEALMAYSTAEMEEAELLAKLEHEMVRIRNKYADELADLSECKHDALETVQVFCREQKEQLFGKRRTLHTMHGSVGYRLGTPKLRTLAGFSWDKVLERMKEKLPAYVRSSEEPAKNKLLADRRKEQVAPLLEEVGLQVIQEEIFFIETL